VAGVCRRSDAVGNDDFKFEGLQCPLVPTAEITRVRGHANALLWARNGRLWLQPSSAVVPVSDRAEHKKKTSGCNYRARNAWNEAPERDHFFHEHQNCKSGDPQYAHDAANKEEGHQSSATADTIGAMLRSEP
jgi:hypothetical protein